MEFPFYVSKVMTIDADGFAILEASVCARSSQFNTTSFSSRNQPYSKIDNTSGGLAQIIDKMGEASSFAQGLRAVITTYGKFISSGDQRLYIKVEENKVCGILKVGKKNLFHHDGINKVKEIRPLCVLDFYVHESMQRHGVGKALFEKMLETEKVEPRKLAYDRPSPKLIGFLKKHYGLAKYVPQNNNYVVFNAYWEDPMTTTTSMNNTMYRKTPEMGGFPIEENKDRRNMAGRNTQTEFHKVGRTILENNPVTYLKNDMNKNMIGFAQNPQPTPYTNNNNIDNPMQYGIINQGRKSLAMIDDPISRTERGATPSTAGSTLRGVEQPVMNTREKPVQPVSDPKKNPYMIATEKGYIEYSTRTPWGNFGGGSMDPYRTSLTYGSYYNQNTRGYGKR